MENEDDVDMRYPDKRNSKDGAPSARTKNVKKLMTERDLAATIAILSASAIDRFKDDISEFHPTNRHN